VILITGTERPISWKETIKEIGKYFCLTMNTKTVLAMAVK
jgi:hypothetical protein